MVDHLVICLGGMAIAPTSRNPFSFVERVEHIKTCFPAAKISYVGIHDHPESNQDWVDEVVNKVNQQSLETKEITLFGHKKDDTGWYMDLFSAKGWKINNFDTDDSISGTKVRHEAYCGNDAAETKGWKEYVPTELFNHFELWLETPAGQARSAEYVKEKQYQADYADLPYPPIFPAVDAFVTCQGHVLLVKRGGLRGRGLYAMPGGHLDSRERMIDGSIRELIEETCINLDPKVIKSYWTGDTLTLDNPNRSLLGRVTSEVFYFALPHDICGGSLPDVKGADDAAEALWMPIEKLRGDYFSTMDAVRIQFFEDHLWAIKELLPDCMALRA